MKTLPRFLLLFCLTLPPAGCGGSDSRDRSSDRDDDDRDDDDRDKDRRDEDDRDEDDRDEDDRDEDDRDEDDGDEDSSKAKPRALPSTAGLSVEEKQTLIETERVDYPDRSWDLRSLEDYQENGETDMAHFVADSIIEQQRTLAAAADGLPEALQAKIDLCEAEKVDYPDRSWDIRSMQSYIENGDFEMAEFMADSIIEQQRTLAGAADGLPDYLQAKIDLCEAEKVDYPDRSSDLRSMRSYIENGDFEMAEFVADSIIEQQRTLAGAADGLPDYLQAKIDRCEAEKVDYPDRSGDLRSLQSYLDNGDFEMAEFMADSILEAQSNLKAGPPTRLLTKIERAEAEKVDYPDRSWDLRSMQSYIENGDYEMAEFTVDGILEQQQELR